MSSSDLPNPGFEAVRKGWWTDHDAGRARRGMLTLSNQEAAALLGFLAVAVTFAGNRSWKIWRFFLYRCFRQNEADGKDARKWTRRFKLILRNVITAASASWMFITQAWEIRGRRRSPEGMKNLVQSIGLVIAAGIHLLAFVAAGILTSRILIGRTVVSKPLDSCGQWEPRDGASSILAWQSLRLNETIDSDNYVRNCYPEGVSQGILDCQKLLTRSLPHQVVHRAQCPFGPDLCTLDKTGAFTMDSGLMTFSSLGVNSKYALRLSIQRRSTCITVPEEPFLEKIYTSSDLPRILSGNQTLRTYAFSANSKGQNTSIPYRDQTFSETYDLQAYHLTVPSNAIIEPLRPGTQGDHDPSVILLRSNGVRFRNSSNDPWFSVHTKLSLDNTTSGISDDPALWVTDRFLNILACKEQVRMCSNITGNCSGWSGLFGPMDDLASLIPVLSGPSMKNGSSGFDEILRTTAVVGLRLPYTSLPGSIQNRPGSQALQASRYLLTSGVQYLLEPEQWKLELNYWFSMALARLQLGLFNTVEKPVGVSTAEAENYWDRYNLKGLCGRIKFHSPEHATLSKTGIIIVIVFVGVLMLGSFLDVVLGWIPAAWAGKLVKEWEEMENVVLLEELEQWWDRVGQFSDPFEVRQEPK